MEEFEKDITFIIVSFRSDNVIAKCLESINPNIKIKESHAKLIANTETSLRNKDPKFREKVSNGLKKYFGSLEERFFNCITKHKNGCWTCSKKTITYNKIDYQAKEISVMLHKIKQTNECITTNCGNNKCVNPKHLIFVSREDTAIKTLSKRKKISRDNGHQSKLSSLDVSNIKKMYNKLFFADSKEEVDANMCEQD